MTKNHLISLEALLVYGRLIVLEGIDSVGKKTQAQELKKFLVDNKGLEVKLTHFPQYDTDFGALVGKYLRGEFGKLDEIPPEIPCLLYALDRYQVRNQMLQDLLGGVYYIADRYTNRFSGKIPLPPNPLQLWVYQGVAF